MTGRRWIEWLPGYFTGCLHAAVAGQLPFLFRAIPIVWSTCGAPVAISRPGADLPVCPACAAQHLRQLRIPD